ncbi:MAG: hypothetical protein IK139_03635 [Lachnospiraceae bacterium]|nr:hypothetical protein [Lachnospiraceae bacterium]
MDNYRKMLEQQLKEIEGMLARSNKNLENYKDLPDQRIDIGRSNGCDQYYWVDDQTKKRRYAGKNEMEMVKKAVQRDYEKAVNKKLDKCHSHLKRLVMHYDISEIDRVYTRMSDARKKLVIPIAEPAELIIKKWKEVSYEPMGFDTETATFLSDNGVRVRSKSELIIANALEKKAVPYRYEYPLDLKGFGIIRPDFFCLNPFTGKEYVWEHFGMMDNIAYANRNVSKIEAYIRNGFLQGKNMIMTFETSQHPLSSNIIKTMIEQYLFTT